MHSFYDLIELNDFNERNYKEVLEIESVFRKLSAWTSFGSTMGFAPKVVGGSPGIVINYFEHPTKETPDLKEFIKLLEVIEVKYGAKVTTVDKLTAFRKIFYNTPGWDKYLIKGVNKIPSPYGPGHCNIKSKTEVRIPHLPLLSFYMTDTECVPVDPGTGQAPVIFKHQEVGVPITIMEVVQSDIAHTLCGLDAFNHTHDVSVKFSLLYKDSMKLGLRSNIDAVTWLGDLGSVLAETLILCVSKEEPFSLPELQSRIEKFAGAADMLGNMDTYNIYNIFSKEILQNTISVSGIFKEYYLGGNAGTYQKQRFLQFAKGIGAEVDVATGNITNRTALGEYLTQQIGAAAALYIMANAEKTIDNLWVVVGFSMAVASHGAAALLSEALLQSIEDALP